MLSLGLGSQPTTECGIFGSYQSLDLDGNSDYVSLPSSIKDIFNKSAATVSAWINLIQNDGDTSQQVCKVFTDTGNQFQLFYHKYETEWRSTLKTQNGTTRKAVYDIPGSSDNDGSGYDDGWQHFVGSFTIGEGGDYSVKLYRNGSLVQNTSGGSGQASWSGAKTLKIQGRSYSSSYVADFNTFRNWDGSADSSGQIRKPQLIITSLG